MKNLALIIVSVLGLSMQSSARGYGYSYINSYADAIVFDEMGVTFSVYPDGEFDFYLGNALQNSTVSNGFVNVTFNSGYNYNPYVQYDDFGAVIQVENVPVWYDHYGRVSQIGDVQISYRNRRVCRVGGLNLFYNGRGHYAYHTGFINTWNPYFVYRPFYVGFARPRPAMCFVRTNPYRQFYRPIRFTYYRPYVNNARPCYATVGHTYRPRGYGQVHSRYTQQARRGEAPVRGERRKITKAQAATRPTGVNQPRVNIRGGNAPYGRNPQHVNSSTARSSRVNTTPRNAQTNRSTGARTVRSNAPQRGGNAAIMNRNSNRKAGSVQSRGQIAPSSQAVRQNSRGTTSSRSVKPSSSSSRTQSVNRGSSRVNTSSNRAVKPRTNARNTVSPSRTVSKPTGSKVRGSSSRSSVSKGSNRSSKPGGKVSVGDRSSKRGR